MENVKESFKFELSLYGIEQTEEFHISQWGIESEAWAIIDDEERSEIIEKNLKQWEEKWKEEKLDKWLERYLETSYE